mmetsp:Transcript_24956/g.72201  ORF Transcript_24956/g.72201 Transcript_24956/m.72201 type:complete len:171 (-) Transcript_24956:1304-1816(-)
MDVAVRRLFHARSIAFPSPLAGCGLLFAALLALHAARAGWGDAAHGALAPGAAVLAKWLPVFFVPSLVTLPLAQSMGDGAELAKVAAVLGGGFLFTLFTTAGSVLAVRKLMGSSSSSSSTPRITAPRTPPPAATGRAMPARPRPGVTTRPTPAASSTRRSSRRGMTRMCT